MKYFLDEDFLLSNKTAEILYHEYAEDMPIIDYHCHLDPREIAENKKYRNITEMWLGDDHYKWRAMRINGLKEKYITGDASDKEKFLKWAESIPFCVGNPLYHWTHLELQRYFGIKTLLSSQTAEEIWYKCNDMLKSNDFSVKNLIKRSNVKAICTTDDPADSLKYHKEIAKDFNLGVKVVPAFRPDEVIDIDSDSFIHWIAKLSRIAGIAINSFDDLKEALIRRIDKFHQMGCRVSDHALDEVVFLEGTETEAAKIFDKALSGSSLLQIEVMKYQTQVLLFLGKEYARRNWVMQLHIGAIRDVNKKMLELLGPDKGFDTIGDQPFADALSKILDAMDQTGELPRTILYCLNPKDNEVIGSIVGCFPGDGIPGKVQFGTAWWFNDQKDGIIRQITALANLGLLSRFIGMTTDSRCFLSYTRHEYFRRILCNIIGIWVENGEVQSDINLLGTMVQNICFNNAKNYFGIL
jgi:glucuronate isomerase